MPPNLNVPAFPIERGSALGLTKYEYVVTHILAGMMANGKWEHDYALQVADDLAIKILS